MASGIYCVEHAASGKKYIGKTKNFSSRFSAHKYLLQRVIRSKDCNRYLWAAVQKYGLEAFKFWIVEELPIDDKLLSERELYWMDFYNSCQRDFGYNLRRDSSSGMEVHESTRKLLSKAGMGENNPNFGNRWTPEMRAALSRDVKDRYARGVYSNPETIAKKRKSAAEANAKINADPEKARQKATRVKQSKQLLNKFLQYTREGEFIREWDTLDDICFANPSYKWQNIYGACNGSKPTYMGFVWRKVSKSNTDYPRLLLITNTYTTPEFYIKKCIQRNKAGIPTLDEALSRFSAKGFSHLSDDLTEAYILKYMPDEYDSWCDCVATQTENDRLDALYGVDGEWLDPMAGLIHDDD